MFAADRLYLGEASERARREHTNEHSAQGLTVDAYPHPACAPLSAAERRACPLAAVRWRSMTRVADGVELTAALPAHPEQLQRMVVCHVAFGRDHATRQCPLHVRGVRAVMRVTGQTMTLAILGQDPGQIVELQQRVRQLVQVVR